MHTLSTFFLDFLAGIRPTEAQRNDYKSGHKLLRERLDDFAAPKL